MRFKSHFSAIHSYHVVLRIKHALQKNEYRTRGRVLPCCGHVPGGHKPHPKTTGNFSFFLQQKQNKAASLIGTFCLWGMNRNSFCRPIKRAFKREVPKYTSLTPRYFFFLLSRWPRRERNVKKSDCGPVLQWSVWSNCVVGKRFWSNPFTLG